MKKAMHNSSLTVKSVFDNIEEFMIAFFEGPPHRICDQIGKLDCARGLRVNEEWYVYNPARLAPRVAFIAKTGSQGL